MEPFQNKLESSSHRNYLVQLNPQTFEIFELRKINFALDQTYTIFQSLFVKLTGKLKN